ncbi:MAG: hydantoinase/oxoprolinase family protein [Gammaproteobacteria bacterium]|nr:hydantoinase/oxoprolinase family protein [Gammaproteobacteria bacterium]
MAKRIGVDIGGTFTDLLFYDDKTNSYIVEKVPTVPDHPEQGCLNAVNLAVSEDLLQESEYFLHGTTVGINALLERKGAKVGLLATTGFRDILEIRRGDRAEMYNLIWTPPPPIVPRHLRLPVNERTMADGSIHLPINDDDVLEALKVFEEEGADSIAVTYLHSYVNPEHELRTETLLREAGFEGAISLSHKVSGEFREYERTTTTAVDAFVRKRMQNYMSQLESDLGDKGFKGHCLITRSGSGCMTFAEAEARPFETIMSGPVAGAEGAAELARALQLGDLITADVGGTSFDTCLIINGRPQLLYQGIVEGLPLQTPWVDVRSIGAGGGSIAHVDAGGLLRVGPQSAGSVPGPACYSRGGEEATVTDAAFYLGMLGEGELASNVKLDRTKAEAAIAKVAAQLGMSNENCARGIVRIACASMSETIREITIEQGNDPRNMSLLAFGGAGPLLASLMAEELDITNIIVPPYAGNFSAWGLLGADLLRATARSHILPVSKENIIKANSILDELFSELESRDNAYDANKWVKEIAIDMRYRGQEHSMTIQPDIKKGRISNSADELQQAFVDAYENSFGGSLETTTEIVSLRATLRQTLPARKYSRADYTDSNTEENKSLQAYSFHKNEWMEFKLYQRAALESSRTYEGPAIVSEQTTTIYIDSNDSFTSLDDGCLLINHSGGAN